MTTTRLFASLATAAALLAGGCASPEMKGTPFYTGDYGVNVPDADERRVNIWPLAYYRDPALSVLWPCFERTEEHVALRPLFSAYGDDKSYWEYNLLWPLCQADTRSRDYRVFPYFWGQTRHPDQRYHVLFPFVWHFEDEAHSLFPLWLYARDRGQGPATDRDCWLLWPLLRYHTAPDETEWHCGPIYDYAYPKTVERYSGYPWPLCFTWRTPDCHGLFTPLYAFEASDRPAVRDGWDALPLLLSWRRRFADDDTLTAALGLFRRHRSADASSGWLLPFFAYDTRDRLLLTPLYGRDEPDSRDPDGFWYPFTPLAGARTGAHRGGWLFPFYSHRASATNDTYETDFLVFGHAEHARRDWRNASSEDTELRFFPLFSRATYQTTTRDPKTKVTTESASRVAENLLLHNTQERTVTSHSSADAGADANYRMTSSSHSLFPLWQAETRTKTRLDGAPLSQTDESSLLYPLYDTKRNCVAADGKTPALDYTRRRVLWRVWHYEKRNGDVSVDLFPFITYDARTDGFRKTSFLWRLYRYEKSQSGKVSFDLLFIPLRRD
jgi:hypothetical protein